MITSQGPGLVVPLSYTPPAQFEVRPSTSLRVVLPEKFVDAERHIPEMQHVAKRGLQPSGRAPNLNVIGALILAAYSDCAGCCLTTIVNFVNGAGRSYNNCLEHLLQLHR